MKAKPPGKRCGTARAKPLHQPPEELREALAMKPRERRKGRNHHSRDSIAAAIKGGWPGNEMRA